jgi:NAD(P)-dependent dehydrogenase (short-subunit alcohol dehydrogenase family)
MCHVALITGASAHGIGRAIALELASRGVPVVLVARNRAGLEESAAVVRSAGGTARTECLDVTDRSAVDATLAHLVEDGWPVDILVNNAADLTLGDALDCTDETWDRVLAVNLTAPFLLSRVVGRSMVRNGWGRIVNVSSVAGEKALPGCAAYAVSKAALVHLTRVMALEMARANVTVNAVSLGPILTDRMMSAHTPESRKWLVSQVPARRMGDPAAVARIVGVLASPESDYITGQVWAVDGGASIA